MFQLPIDKELKDSKNILICGCGGGYDFFAGIPFFLQLTSQKKNCFLSNLSFTPNLQKSDGKRYPKGTDYCIEVTPNIKFEKGEPSFLSQYFPERLVSVWMKKNEGLDVPVYTFPRNVGPKFMREAYQAIIDEKKIDTIILVDNGTDSLMFGTEEKLGSPEEDMTSIAAIHGLKLEKKYLLNLGFGVDTYHGVNHFRYLENVSKLIKDGGFLGAFSLLKETEEAQKMEKCYLDCQPENSIVTSSVTSAFNGEFGNFHHEATKNRTSNSELFISPLMSLYWCFKLDHVAKNIIYMNDIMNLETHFGVGQKIYEWHQKQYKENKIRKNKVIPQ